MEKLDSHEFARWLREGRGKALMHVLAHGLGGVDEIVLKACLEEQAYDAQCEGHRAAWLYRMFKGAPEYEFFRRKIFAEFAEMSEDCSAEQLCELASLMALDGDTEAGTVLRSYVWGQDFLGGDGVFAVYGCHAIAALDGMPAIVEIARRYGRILLADPLAFLDTLDELTDGEEAYALAFAELTKLKEADSSVAAYLGREQEEIDRCLANARQGVAENAARLEQNRAEILEQFPLDQALAAARKHDKSRGKFVRFGRWSDGNSLAAVLGQLGVESDDETCLRLLWVFRNAAPPYIPERLWTLSEHHDARIRDAALTALAQVDDPAVGEFGRQFLRRGTFSSEDAAAIELFTKHYMPGDEDIILDVLNSLSPGETEAHDIGMSIRAFCKNNNLPSVAGILNWLYCTNPCTICRGHAVELLIESNSLSPETAMECRFDASSAVQDLVIHNRFHN